MLTAEREMYFFTIKHSGQRYATEEKHILGKNLKKIGIALNYYHKI